MSDWLTLVLGGIAPMATCALAVAASHVAWPRSLAGPWVECPLRLVIGLAAVVLALRLLVQFMPGAHAAILVVAALGAIATFAIARRSSTASPTRRRPGYVVWPYVFAAVALCVLRLWPAAVIGQLTPFEGTGNHDELYYVFVAERLLHESVLAMAANPGSGLLLPFDAILPRLGVESLMATYAQVLGLTTAQAYPVASVLGSVLWAAATAVIVMDPLEDARVGRGLALALVVVSPQVAGIVANNNLAMLFGSAFVGIFVWTTAATSGARRSGAYVALAGLSGAAALACYHEILPTLLAGGGLAIIAGFWKDRAPLQRVAVTTLAIAAIGVATYPLLAWDLHGTLVRHLGGGSFTTPWDSMLLGMDPAGVLLRTFTLDPAVPGAWLRRYEWVVAAAIAVALCMSGRRALLTVGPLLAAGLLALAMTVLLDYHYGELKAIQTLAMPLTALVALVGARWLATLRNRGTPDARAAPGGRAWPLLIACGLVAMAFQAYTFATDFARYGRLAQEKHLTRDLLALGSLDAVLPAGSTTYVSADLGEYPFLRSRWIAYEMRDRPLIFHPRYHGGGYLRGLEKPYADRFDRSQFVLAQRDRGPLMPNTVHPALRNGSFQLVDLRSEPYVELVGGFHEDEGAFRWMAQSAVIEVLGPRPRALHVAFVGRYARLSGESAVDVDAGGQSHRFDLADGRGAIVVPFPQSGAPRIVIRALLDAKSPRDVGDSADWRTLSFQVGRIWIE